LLFVEENIDFDIDYILFKFHQLKRKELFMGDDLKKKRPQDASKVNIHEPWEVNYWCGEFNCTKVQLEAAVKSVGVSAEAVRRYLKR
jgi:hypothetical protein